MINIMSTGRKREIRELERLYDSQSAEFVAVYGRQKAFLISNISGDRITLKTYGALTR